MACEIFLDQGLNLCLLHWQADSYPPASGKSQEVYLYLYTNACSRIPYGVKKEEEIEQRN